MYHRQIIEELLIRNRIGQAEMAGMLGIKPHTLLMRLNSTNPTLAVLSEELRVLGYKLAVVPKEVHLEQFSRAVLPVTAKVGSYTLRTLMNDKHYRRPQ